MNKYKFIDYPQKKKNKHYDEVRKKIVDSYNNDKFIHSAYEYGQVNAPGISDLDIILVFKKKSPFANNQYDFKKIDKQANDLVKYGNIIKMDIATLKSMEYLDNFNLKLLFGPSIDLLKISKAKKKYRNLISIVDWLPERILRLQTVVNNDIIHISNSLCLLNSICFSLKSITKYINKKKDLDYVINQTGNLRSMWFNIEDPEKKLIDLISITILLGYKCLNAYIKYLHDNRIFKKTNHFFDNEIIYKIYKNSFIVFTSDKKKLNPKLIKLDKDYLGKNIVYISFLYYPHFHLLASNRLSLSRVMKKKITPFSKFKVKLNDSYKNMLIQKLKIINKNSLFLKKHNFKSGLIRYGFNHE